MGPEHSWLKDTGRAEYVAATDDQALEALQLLARKEGLISALEPSHAVYGGMQVRQLGGVGVCVLFHCIIRCVMLFTPLWVPYVGVHPSWSSRSRGRGRRMSESFLESVWLLLWSASWLMYSLLDVTGATSRVCPTRSLEPRNPDTHFLFLLFR